MSAPSALVIGGSLRLLMNEIIDAERTLNDEITAAKVLDLVPQELPYLSVVRWRPSSFDAPGIYHGISPSPFEQQDQLRWRDVINVVVRIGVAYGNDSSEMDFLEAYTDLWRQVMDPLILGPAGQQTRPFNGTAQWAERTDMRSVQDSFNDIPYACMEFIIQARMDRLINPT